MKKIHIKLCNETYTIKLALKSDRRSDRSINHII